MKIAFAKNPTTFIQKSICKWTKSDYFHVELAFNCGASFSAISSENKTRFAWLTYDNNWDIIDLPFDYQQERTILKWCDTEVNCKYDWLGITFTQIIPLSFENPWWWFCSEVCMTALQQVGWFEGFYAYQYDPGELYRLVKEKLK